MKIHNKLPQEITDKQKDGKKYIVFDRDYDPVEWVVASYQPIKDPLNNVQLDGYWLTATIEPKVIHPTHYVEIADDVI